jgi:DNA-directed RNA polymerase specialized sigma24 family protein
MDTATYFEQTQAIPKLMKKFRLDLDDATSAVIHSTVRIDQYKGKIEKPEHFCTTVLHNEAKRLAKWHNKHKASRLDEFDLVAPPAPEKPDDWPTTVFKLLDLRLREKDLELLRLIFVEKKDYRAVAQALGISATAARWRFCRIKKMALARRLAAKSAA